MIKKQKFTIWKMNLNHSFRFMKKIKLGKKNYKNQMNS